MTVLESIVEELAREVMRKGGEYAPNKPFSGKEKLGILIEDWQNAQEVLKAARVVLARRDIMEKTPPIDPHADYSDGLGEQAAALKTALDTLDKNRLEKGLG